VNLLHIINIVIQLANLYLDNPVISIVTLASGGICVKLSATRSNVPHHTYTWWGPLLESVGAPIEPSLRLVLGDEDISGALVIDIAIDQIQYSCYLMYMYAWSCWQPV